MLGNTISPRFTTKTGVHFDGAASACFSSAGDPKAFIGGLSTSTDMSISFWFVPYDENSTTGAIMGGKGVSPYANDKWWLKVNSVSDRLELQAYDNGVGRIVCYTDSNSLDAHYGKWTHVLFTWDFSDGVGNNSAGAGKFYINGSLVDTDTTTCTAAAIIIQDKANPFSIGSVGTDRVKMDLAQLGVWHNVVLNADDATALYNVGIEGDWRKTSGNYDVADVANLDMYYVFDANNTRFVTGNADPNGITIYDKHLFKNLAVSHSEENVLTANYWATGQGYTGVPFAGTTESIDDGAYKITGHNSNFAAYGHIVLTDIVSDSAPTTSSTLYIMDWEYKITAGVGALVSIGGSAYGGTENGEWKRNVDVIKMTRSDATLGFGDAGDTNDLIVMYSGGHDSNTTCHIKINTMRKFKGVYSSSRLDTVSLY